MATRDNIYITVAEQAFLRSNNNGPAIRHKVRQIGEQQLPIQRIDHPKANQHGDDSKKNPGGACQVSAPLWYKRQSQKHCDGTNRDTNRHNLFILPQLKKLTSVIRGT